MYTSFKWQRPPIEDALKILKVEYLSNHLLHHTQITNLSLDDQTILYNFKWSRPIMEDDLKILLNLLVVMEAITETFNFLAVET